MNQKTKRIVLLLIGVAGIALLIRFVFFQEREITYY